MIAATIVSTVLGGLYGAFEVYKDYMDMKTKIAEYVTPDLTEIYKKMEVLEATSNKSVEYTQDIKNDLKNDIRRLEGVVENVERSSKSGLRDSDQTVNTTKKEVDSAIKEIRRYSDQTIKELNQEMVRNQKETQTEIKQLKREVDDKIKKALDNPLSNN
jgi:DNA anti-recombination protein RmuC